MQNGPNTTMHPQDMRNMLIFFVLCMAVYFAYDHFLIAPKKAAMERARQEMILQQQEATASGALPAQVQPHPRADVIAESTRIAFSNAAMEGSISLKGARIDDLSLKNYFTALDKKEKVVLLSPAGTEFPRYIEHGWVSSDTSLTLPGPETPWNLESGGTLEEGKPIVLFWDNGQGLTFRKTISVDDSFMFTVRQNVVNHTGKPVSIHPYGLVSQGGTPSGLENRWISHEGPIGFIGDRLEEGKYKEMRKKGGKTFEAANGWIGITEKYWLSALLPVQGQDVKYSFTYAPADALGVSEKFQTDFVAPALIITPGGTASYETHAFSGAKRVLALEEYSKKLEVRNFDLAVDFGWFWFLSKPFFYALHFLNEMTGNMGVAIILLTIIIRSSVFPLTNVSYRSFAKMKKVAPFITELREKYKDDKQGLQQELIKMYEREGVNPMAGCIPILLQIPIFFALYKTLFITIEMRHAPFAGWIHDLSAADPTNVFTLFGLIPWDAPAFLHVGIWPCMMMVGMIIQKKLNPPPQDPIQRDMANYFPFLITYVMSKFASGLVIYWTFSAFIGIIQQVIIMRSLNVPIYIFSKDPADKKLEEGVEQGPAIHPLAAMAEQEVEDALFDNDDPGSDVKKISAPRKKKKKKK